MFQTTRTVFLTASLASVLCAGLCSSVAAQSAPAKATASSDQQIPKSPIVFAGLAHLELSVSTGHLHATVHGASPGFFGVVLLSTSADQTQLAAGLPPLLSDFVVWGAGYTATQDLELRAPTPLPDWAQKLCGQALAFDQYGVWVSGIVRLALPVSNVPVLEHPATNRS